MGTPPHLAEPVPDVRDAGRDGRGGHRPVDEGLRRRHDEG